MLPPSQHSDDLSMTFVVSPSRVLRAIPLRSPKHPFTHLRGLRVSSPALPQIAQCPPPTRACAAMPEMPEGLEIDRKKPMKGARPRHSQHVVVCTGRSDWPSRIENGEGATLAKDLKAAVAKPTLLRNSGPIMVSNSNLVSGGSSGNLTSVYLFPKFKVLRTGTNSLQLQSVLLDKISPSNLERSNWRDVNEVVILICGHGSRDARCGIMGPLLQSEFERVLPGAGFAVPKTPVDVSESATEAVEKPSARVGLVTHIGGHIFAGNVIIFIPPFFRVGGMVSPLAGREIWYGRVEPKHVEGIVNETVVNGRIIEELLRGVVPA